MRAPDPSGALRLLCFMADYTTKARYWMAICYPENMVDDWQSKIGDLLQVPYCYVIHDKDLVKDGLSRKIHVHIMIALGNTTTYKAALSIFKTLNGPNHPTCIPNDEIRQVRSVRSVYEYFIHNTDDCRALGKYQYSPKERICGNLFDIGSYEQLGQAEKDKLLIDITNICFDNNIQNFATLITLMLHNFDIEYFNIVKCNNGYFQALTKGIYLQNEADLRNQQNDQDISPDPSQDPIQEECIDITD